MEWDGRKNLANIKKHRLSFEQARKVFDDPNAIEYYDGAHSKPGENRYVCIGDIGGFVIAFVVYEDRNGDVRIISRGARRQKKDGVIMTDSEKTRLVAAYEANAVPDDEIDFSDMPELADEQLAQMKPCHWRPRKEVLSVRADADLLEI